MIPGIFTLHVCLHVFTACALLLALGGSLFSRLVCSLFRSCFCCCFFLGHLLILAAFSLLEFGASRDVCVSVLYSIQCMMIFNFKYTVKPSFSSIMLFVLPRYDYPHKQPYSSTGRTTLRVCIYCFYINCGFNLFTDRRFACSGTAGQRCSVSSREARSAHSL